jgi:hypothetical protein
VEAAILVVHPAVTALGIVQRHPARVEAGNRNRWWLQRRSSLSRRTFVKMSYEGPKNANNITQYFKIKAVLSMPVIELEVGKLSKTEGEPLMISVMGPAPARSCCQLHFICAFTVNSFRVMRWVLRSRVEGRGEAEVS